ncbi:hypothetical protein EVAR_24655_1 [Eumeta japonica]|uniref:Uncharacterized protein n=1 Tax=Eumeta variegata TaxID=151549 RepID=A0A4C1V159_EUMVA|nr:hypothetical protein EVAR_24655_1 [Eumeta japonica]
MLHAFYKPLRVGFQRNRLTGRVFIELTDLFIAAQASKSGGRSTTATDAPILLQFIDGVSACTYNLHTLQWRGRGDALRIFHVRIFMISYPDHFNLIVVIQVRRPTPAALTELARSRSRVRPPRPYFGACACRLHNSRFDYAIPCCSRVVLAQKVQADRFEVSKLPEQVAYSSATEHNSNIMGSAGREGNSVVVVIVKI